MRDSFTCRAIKIMGLKDWESLRAFLIPTWRFLPFLSMYFFTVWPGQQLCSAFDMKPARAVRPSLAIWTKRCHSGRR
eukprot:g1254.t1